MNTEESAAKQKSRNQWLQLGDTNSAYFFASAKSRMAQNKIRNLVSSNGDMLQTEDDIKKEITCFYKQLLRSAANHLPVINPEIMKEGQFLNRDMQLMLIEPVTRQEIV